jgi:hypothetical protein
MHHLCIIQIFHVLLHDGKFKHTKILAQLPECVFAGSGYQFVDEHAFLDHVFLRQTAGTDG